MDINSSYISRPLPFVPFTFREPTRNFWSGKGRVIKKAEARERKRILELLDERWEEIVSSLIDAKSTRRTMGYLDSYSTFNSESNGL